MKWISNLNIKLISVLIGISLTTLSLSAAILLYPILKKDDDSKKSRKIVTSKGIVTEYKIPKEFVSAVIGRNGFVINDIRDKTGTSINICDDLKSQDYICTIKGSDIESVRLAESLIKNIIDNRPIIENYELFVPLETSGKILKKNVVQMLHRTTGVKIVIDRAFHISEDQRQKRIILKGTAEQIASAVTEIEDIVREINEVHTQMKCELAKRTSRSAPNNNISSNNGLEPSEIPLSQDGLMEVYVTAMESPSRFWIHVLGPGNIALVNLEFKMTEYYNKKENRELHILKKIQQGQIVAAKFTNDGKWYRGVVKAIISSKYEVWFVDYGDKDIVSAEDILELRTDMLSLRPQAVECSLANVKPRENEWDTEAIDKFAELVSLSQWKVFIAKVKGYKERSGSGRDGSQIPCFDLYDNNDDKKINIGETLVRLKLAQFNEEIYNHSAVSSTLPRDECSENEMDFPSTSSTPLVERVSKATKPVLPLQSTKAIDTATPEEKLQIEQSIKGICVETPKEKDEINDFLTNERKILTSDANIKLYDRT